MTQVAAISRYSRTELSDEGRDLLRERTCEKQAENRGYSFARAGSLWVPKRRKLECWGSGTAGAWATRNMGAPRDTPLTLPGAANIESWHEGGRGLTLGATLRRGGTAAPADMIITGGSRVQSLGLRITTSAGALGVATYAAYIDGGGSPIQTGPTAASVLLAPVGLTISMPSGTYSSDNVYEGVVESWANLTPKTRTLLSVGAVSAQPQVLWSAQNGRPAIHSAGGSTGYLIDSTSDWAAQVASGNDRAFTIFVVCKTDDAAPSGIRTMYGFGHGTNPDACWFLGIRNGTNVWKTQKIDDGAVSAQRELGALDTNYHVHRLVQHGTTVDHYIDGVLVYSGFAQDVGTTTLNVVALFALLRAGAATNALNGAICAEASYNTDLSPADLVAVEQYFRTGWAL